MSNDNPYPKPQWASADKQAEAAERMRLCWNACAGIPDDQLERLDVAALLAELEQTADKLSGVWIHLDSWARGEAPSLEFIKQAAAGILKYQQAPGWKGGAR